MADYDVDLLVIGSGPAGQKAAIQAAKLRGRRVGIVERREVGGVSVDWGTIPSKTLREAIVYLTGLSQRTTYGESYRVKEEITMEDLRVRTRRVIDGEVDVVSSRRRPGRPDESERHGGRTTRHRPTPCYTTLRDVTCEVDRARDLVTDSCGG